MDKFRNYKNTPKNLKLLLKAIFPNKNKSINIEHKCGTTFQLVYYLIHNGKKNIPLHIRKS